MDESIELAKELVDYTKLVGVHNEHIQQVAQKLLTSISGNVNKRTVNIDSEELLKEAEYVMEEALNYTHPTYEQFYPTFDAVYRFASNVKSYLNEVE